MIRFIRFFFLFSLGFFLIAHNQPFNGVIPTILALSSSTPLLMMASNLFLLNLTPKEPPDKITLFAKESVFPQVLFLAGHQYYLWQAMNLPQDLMFISLTVSAICLLGLNAGFFIAQQLLVTSSAVDQLGKIEERDRIWGTKEA